MKQSVVPLIIAIVLLVLPVLYVGSYLALVTPRGTFVEDWDRFGGVRSFSYRYGGDRTATIFWPLEQIDRKLRPKAWWG